MVEIFPRCTQMICGHKCAGRVGERRMLNLLELEFQAIVNGPIGVVGTELGTYTIQYVLLTTEPSHLFYILVAIVIAFVFICFEAQFLSLNLKLTDWLVW